MAVLKKKGKADIEDLFTDDAFVEEDLIKDVAAKTAVEPPQPASSASAKEGETAAKKSAKAKKTKKLDPAVRRERFEKHIQFIEPRVGRKPTVKDARIRKRMFVTLLDLAASEDELRKIVALIPRYKEVGGELIDSFAEAFVRRCQELQCPPLALEVFGNYAKYDIRLNLEAAQWLVHSLYISHPLEKLMIATALYPVYNLPPVSEDLASASMVAAACYKHKTPESLSVAEALRPKINAMLEQVQISQAPDHASKKKNKWIAWSLQRANKAKGGEPFVPWKSIPLKIRVERPSAQTAQP
ncbi:hypothetical protein BDZ97DRAFT_1665763 [Flammula alnicola]|nr:hypothetical protein BDZ97DRAFT_1665763 [Flammula alnicola]